MKQLARVAAAAALILTSCEPARAQAGGAASEEGVEVQATGRVVSPSQDNFTLEVRGMRFRVVHTPALGQRRAEVRQGDRVRVSGSLVSADQIRAETVTMLQRASGRRESTVVTGTIRRIDREQKEMRVATSDGVVRVEWGENTEFVRDTVRSGPREFFVGEAVRVAGRRTAPNEMQARRVVFGGRPGWTTGAVGEIVGIDARSREIDVDFDGEVWTVRLGTAAIRRRDQRIQIDDLRIGEDVRVTGSGRANRTVDGTQVEVLRAGDRE